MVTVLIQEEFEDALPKNVGVFKKQHTVFIPKPTAECAVLLGRNGAGKTTFIRILSRSLKLKFINPQSKYEYVRKMTLATRPYTFNINNSTFTLIDTPGHDNFAVECKALTEIVSSCIKIIDVEDFMSFDNVPSLDTITIFNKCDKINGSDFLKKISSLIVKPVLIFYGSIKKDELLNFYSRKKTSVRDIIKNLKGDIKAEFVFKHFFIDQQCLPLVFTTKELNVGGFFKGKEILEIYVFTEEFPKKTLEIPKNVPVLLKLNEEIDNSSYDMTCSFIKIKIGDENFPYSIAKTFFNLKLHGGCFKTPGELLTDFVLWSFNHLIKKVYLKNIDKKNIELISVGVSDRLKGVNKNNINTNDFIEYDVYREDVDYPTKKFSFMNNNKLFISKNINENKHKDIYEGFLQALKEPETHDMQDTAIFYDIIKDKYCPNEIKNEMLSSLDFYMVEPLILVKILYCKTANDPVLKLLESRNFNITNMFIAESYIEIDGEIKGYDFLGLECDLNYVCVGRVSFFSKLSHYVEK